MGLLERTRNRGARTLKKFMKMAQNQRTWVPRLKGPLSVQHSGQNGPTPTSITIKFQITRSQEKILQASREKKKSFHTKDQ